ncbi:MAG TPA: SDR family oxidoreductase [Solirubrobacteraceae bacterium]
MSGPLDGRLALVTGVHGNLGPVWVEALSGAGATVVGIDAAAGAERLAALEIADITDRSALAAACERIFAAHGVPHVLVNNAGVDQPPVTGARSGASVEDVDLDGFRRVLEVNLAGTFAVCQVAGGAMAAQGRGSIINIGSMYASLTPDPALYDHMRPPFLKPPAYGASKAGLVHLTRYLAKLWGPQGVRVNALSPGGVLGGQDEEFLAKFTARTPLRRLAEASDLTGPLLFLASDASRYMTGQDLRIDGGFSA